MAVRDEQRQSVEAAFSDLLGAQARVAGPGAVVDAAPA